jgi:hypothetical protein
MKPGWFPFKGLTLEIRFRATPDKWTRGKIVAWNHPYPFQFQFVKAGRVRPMNYLQEEIWGMKVITMRGDQEKEGTHENH